MPKVIEPCDDPRGHFWRPVDGRTSQCSRCGECASDEEVGERDARLAEQVQTTARIANEAAMLRLRAEQAEARAEAAEQDARTLAAKCAEAVPTNWCDPLLVGSEACLHGNGGTWGCPDIERLLRAIKARIDACMGATTEQAHDD